MDIVLLLMLHLYSEQFFNQYLFLWNYSIFRTFCSSHYDRYGMCWKEAQIQGDKYIYLYTCSVRDYGSSDLGVLMWVVTWLWQICVVSWQTTEWSAMFNDLKVTTLLLKLDMFKVYEQDTCSYTASDKY